MIHWHIVRYIMYFWRHKACFCDINDQCTWPTLDRRLTMWPRMWLSVAVLWILIIHSCHNDNNQSPTCCQTWLSLDCLAIRPVDGIWTRVTKLLVHTRPLQYILYDNKRMIDAHSHWISWKPAGVQKYTSLGVLVCITRHSITSQSQKLQDSFIWVIWRWCSKKRSNDFNNIEWLLS
jgi:hypothetical protein